MAAAKPNPTRLASLEIAGAFLAASSWLLNFLPIHRVHDPCLGLWATMWANRLTFVILGVPLIGGGLLMWWAGKHLRKGVLDEVWSEAELSSVRTLIAKPIWTWVTWLFFAACITELALTLPSSNTHHGGGFFYVLLLPAQVIQRIKQLVSPPKVVTGGLKDWRSFKPIQSEHWGEQRNDGQLSA